MGVTRRTAEIYRREGLLDGMLRDDASATAEFLSLWSETLTGGEEWGRIPLPPPTPEASPCRPFHCPQPRTEQVLMEALHREPLAEVRLGHEVLSWQEQDHGLVLEVRSHEGTISRHEAAWLVAADGAASGIRSKLGIGTDGPGDLGHFLNVYFHAPYGRNLRGRRALLHQVLNSQMLEFLVSVNGHDLWLMHHFLQPGEREVDFSSGRLTEIIRAASGCPEVPVQILGISPWVMSPKLAQAFRRGRVLLTGDAAARLSPAGGLGLNTGLQSVHNLAWKLAAVVQGRAPEVLLDSYEAERRPFSSSAMEDANANSGEIFEILGQAMAGDWDQVRKLIAGSHRRDPGLALDLGFQYPCGAFVPDPAAESPEEQEPAFGTDLPARSGRRAPHLEILRQGQPGSTLDLYGRSQVMLCGPEATAWLQAAPEELEVRVAGRDFEVDLATFQQRHGIDSRGAVLVRPDGILGARFPTIPEDLQARLNEAIRTCWGFISAS